MRIGLDTTCLLPPFTGIPNYVLNLLAAMIDLPEAAQHTIVGFQSFRWHDADRAFVDAIRNGQNDRQGTAGVRRPSLLTRTRRLVSRYPHLHAAGSKVRGTLFSSTLPRLRLDVFHASMSRAPGATGEVAVLPIVYDLSFLRFPELHPKSRVNWLAPVEDMCRTAPMIHTISEAVRSEIMQRFGRSAADISVIPPGVNEIYLTSDLPDTDILRRLNIGSRAFALTVSTLEPRKNFKTLLTAYRALTRAERERMPLVLVGTHGWGDTDMDDSLDALAAEGTLRLTGYVSNHDLRTLYRHARSMFYASIYEGYGMPITEALALGCPVVVSATSSMPEAACGQGHLVEPLDADAWLAELRRALVDDAAHERDKREARRMAVAGLTWIAAARKTLALYDVVIERTRANADTTSAGSR